MGKTRIMIIEDDLELLSILHDFFAGEGFDVTVYPDKNSIKGVIINRPHIVLLDERLRDGFGHELCEEIKANELTQHTRVILTSGIARLTELAEESGADACIAKPFDLNVLLELVKAHLPANGGHGATAS